MAAWESLGKTGGAEDADLSVVAGPQTPFSPGRRTRSTTPRPEATPSSWSIPSPTWAVRPRTAAREAFLASWGVKLENDIVIDRAKYCLHRTRACSMPTTSAPTDLDPRLGEDGFAVFLPRRSVASAPHPCGLSATALVQTTPDGWGRTDLEHLSAVQKDAARRSGAVDVAMAVPREAGGRAGGPRRLRGDCPVVGWRPISRRTPSPRRLANANPVLNTIHWLIGASELVGIAPKTPEQNTDGVGGTSSGSDSCRLGSRPALAAGVAVWAKRSGQSPAARDPLGAILVLFAFVFFESPQRRQGERAERGDVLWDVNEAKFARVEIGRTTS